MSIFEILAFDRCHQHPVNLHIHRETQPARTSCPHWRGREHTPLSTVSLWSPKPVSRVQDHCEILTRYKANTSEAWILLVTSSTRGGGRAGQVSAELVPRPSLALSLTRSVEGLYGRAKLIFIFIFNPRKAEAQTFADSSILKYFTEQNGFSQSQKSNINWIWSCTAS